MLPRATGPAHRLLAAIQTKAGELSSGATPGHGWRRGEAGNATGATRQQGHTARCALTEKGQAYWDHLPEVGARTRTRTRCPGRSGRRTSSPEPGWRHRYSGAEAAGQVGVGGRG